MAWPVPYAVGAGYGIPAAASHMCRRRARAGPGAAPGAPGGAGDGVQTISPDVAGVTSLGFGPDGRLSAAPRGESSPGAWASDPPGVDHAGTQRPVEAHRPARLLARRDPPRRRRRPEQARRPVVVRRPGPAAAPPAGEARPP